MKEPDKWCIKITPENKEAVEKWRTVNVTLNGRGYCVNKTSFNSMIGHWYPDKPSGYTEISFEEFKVYTSKPKDLTGRYVKCLVDRAQGTNCKAGEIYKLVSLDNTVETQMYKLEDGLCLCISPTTTDKWELLPEDYSADKPLKQAVYCETQEEWDFACDKYDKEKRIKTEFGKKYNTFNYTSSFREWNTKEYYIEENYQILSFQEWCDLNGYKIEREIKFEVGKWYRVTDGTCKAIGKNIWYAKSPKLIDGIIICEEYIYQKINKGGNFGGLGGYTFTEVSIEEIQQYLPEGHPDKIKSSQEFKVGDYVVLQYSSAKEIGYNTASNNTRLKAGHIDKIANFRDGQTWRENSKIRWVGLESNPHNGVIEILLRHATQEEINNHLISIGQIQQYLPDNQEFKIGDWVVVLEEDGFYINSEKCPQKLIGIGGYSLPYRLLFKDGHNNSYEKIRHATEKEMQEYFRKNDDLLKEEIEAKTNEYFNEILDRMKEETPKSSYHLLSINDEELPMVNIIKTNTVKQLLNND